MVHKIKTIDGGQHGKVLIVPCKSWLQYLDFMDLVQNDGWDFDNSDTCLFQYWETDEDETIEIHPLMIIIEHHPSLEPGLYRTFIDSDFAVEYKSYLISHERFMKMYEHKSLYTEEDLWEAMDELEDLILKKEVEIN